MPDQSSTQQPLVVLSRLSGSDLAKDEAVATAAATALSRGRIEPNAARAVDRFQLTLDPQRALQYLREIRRLRQLLEDLYEQVHHSAVSDARSAAIEQEVMSLRAERS